MSRLKRLQKGIDDDEKMAQKSKPKKQKEEKKEEVTMKYKNFQIYGPNDQNDNGIQQYLQKGVNAAFNQIKPIQKPEQFFKMNEFESITKPIVKNDSDADSQKSYNAYISDDDDFQIPNKVEEVKQQVLQKSSIETTQQQFFTNNFSQQIQVEENIITAEYTQEEDIMQEDVSMKDDNSLDKLQFILIGESKEYTRKEIVEAIKFKGGKTGFQVTKNTILIIGEEHKRDQQLDKNYQYQAALKKNNKIFNVNEFSQFLKERCGQDLKKLIQLAQSSKSTIVQQKEEIRNDNIEIEEKQELQEKLEKQDKQENQEYRLLIEPQSYQSKSKNFFDVDMRQSNKKQQYEEVVKIQPIIQNNNKEKLNQLWSVKYAPQKISECIDQTHVPIIVDWLSQWSKNKNQIDYGSYAKFNMGSNACLLSGPPGVGKTTMVRLICKDMKFQLIEWNASDVRSKLAMENQVKHLNDNSVLKFQKGNIQRDEQTVILMDEVDGMSGSDKGGSRALTDLIKLTKNPIFCICNERNDQKMRNLAQNCLDIQFKAPDPQRVLKRLEHICAIEQIAYDKDDLMAQINVCQSDIRQLLNILQMHKFSNKIKFGQSVGKDSSVTTNLFEATNYMLQHEKHKGKTVAKNLELYYIDADMISLMYQENYLDIKDPKNTSMIKNAARAAQSLADADILNTRIRRNNEWALMPNAGFLGTLYPTQQMKGKFYGRVNFPSLLGKISSMNKTKRQIQEIKEQFGKQTMQSSVQAIKYDIIEYYAFILISQLKDNAIDPCIRLLQNYGQTVSSFQESVVNCLSIFPKMDVYANVDQELRSTLLKEFKAQSDTMSKIEGGRKGYAKTSQTTKKYNELEDDNDQFEDVEENDEEQPKTAPVKKQGQKQKQKKTNVQQEKKVKQKKVVKEVQKKKKKL